MRYRFGGFTLDTATRELRGPDGPVDVEPQVLDVLAHLAEHRERLVPKEELLDEIWGDRFVSESTLTTRVKQARQAVGDNGRDQAVIKTVHGRGYRFAADVAVLDGAGPETDRAASPVSGFPLSGPAAMGRLPRTRYAPSEGASIAYQVFGEGPPVVLIAGFTTNVEVQWEHPRLAAFLRRLGSFSRVVVLDKRGVGLSDRIGDEAPSLETRADDVRAVLDDAGIERATILGSSEGGALSILFAAAHPESVERLVLHGTFARHPWLGQDREEMPGIEKFWGTGAILRYVSPSFVADRNDARFLARLERQSATPGTARRLQALSVVIDLTDVLGAIDVPTLVVHRVGDEVIPIMYGRELAAGIRGAELVELPGNDHWLFGGDSAEVLDAVERFVTGTPAPDVPGDRVLATVLFVDIVGSTEVAREMGDQRWSALLDEFYATGRQAVAASRGEVVNTTGDGFVALFDGPGRGVLAATQLRSAVRSLGLRVRCGLHTAEIERRGADIAGIGVHVASRVAGAAPPDEVWVSRTVTDLVAGTGLDFRSCGPHQLEGLDQAWELFAVRS